MSNSKIKVLLIALVFFTTTSAIHARDLPKILERGVIEFAAYENFPPFSYKSESGKATGIDIDIGKAIAEKLGVKAKFRLVTPDESVEDDLRVYVWKGHFTAGDISDVMLHMPFDPHFAKRIPQATFIPPYFQEQVVIAYDPNVIQGAVTFEGFIGKKIGVEIETISDMYLLGAYEGQLRDDIVHFHNVTDAGQALLNKEIEAVMANRAEVEASLGDSRENYVIRKVPMPGLPTTSWDVGMAVKSSNEELASTLISIMKDLLQTGVVSEIIESHGVTPSLPSSIHAIEAKLDENNKS